MAFVDEIPVGDIKDVYAYWLGRRAGSRVPLRRDMDPVEFKPDWLPNLFMYRVENGRFRCILVGTRIVEVFGRDETGMFLDEILPPKHAPSRQRLFERAVRDRLPVYYVGPALTSNPRYPRVSRLLLPVSSDGVAADHVFGIVKFGPVAERGWENTRLVEHNEPARIVVATYNDLEGSGS
ncbi:MAG: PAS domain-containing protein [Alphaproteobacteria bacterium]|nr:PAS domain-containing protein [Alphaproteobacteria bacterium]